MTAGRSLRDLAGIPVTRLHGLGPRKAAALESMGIGSILDLLTTYPFRYIDRNRRADLSELGVGEEALVLGTVGRVRARRTRNGRALVEMEVDDGTGAMTVSFFNQPWRATQLAEGTEALFWGKLTLYRGTRRMANPVVDVVVEAGSRTMRVVPVYPATAAVSSSEIGRWVAQALARAGRLADPLPAEVVADLGLIERDRAFHAVHLPEAMGDVEPARRRLAFDELFRLQLALALRRRATEQGARAIRHAVSALEVVSPDPGTLVGRFLAGLPFALTQAQRRALAAIFAELAGPLPMHRLLQGDVGSGKTVVAVAAMLAAVEGGHQAALMAPTEVLAVQHAAEVRRLVAGLTVPTGDGNDRPVTVSLVTGRTHGDPGVADGSADLVVGTHALLTDEVRFRSLGVAVVDEQHRFGVDQRAALRAKGAGADPDLLVMTATPIPRTAAMVRFGDLDMVVLDELPPGRRPVETRWARTAAAEREAWARVRAEVAAGNRAFVVCPLVEGERARAATAERDRLAGDVLAGLRLGLLHGQMPGRERDGVMDAFRRGDLDVLVATTVVEVGVDVPEATVMVVEDAAHFGIAQLHQLRGRVGRSARPSWCYLLGQAGTPQAHQRLAALERTADGFELAEVDLDLRGEGTILGARQRGRSDLRLATLRKDADLLEVARQRAGRTGDPSPELVDEVRLFLEPEEEAYLFKS